MEALKRIANGVGCLMVSDIELDAIHILPNGLRLRAEIWPEDGSVALQEHRWIRWCGDCGVINALNEVAGASRAGTHSDVPSASHKTQRASEGHYL